MRQLPGHAGNVNALVFSADGKFMFAASGENGLFGEVKQWQVADGQLLRTIRGHRDTLYALALSPDGTLIATGSYDQQIKLWSVQTGEERKTLRGHNGAVFALAFRPDGQILASASADRTIKLWDVATGQRRDTLSQPTKEQVTVAWSKDGKRLAAAGFDNRLRVWEVSPEAKRRPTRCGSRDLHTNNRFCGLPGAKMARPLRVEPRTRRSNCGMHTK